MMTLLQSTKLIFLGAPGVGKGTMATRLATEASLPHISTGDIFRSNIASATELGIAVKAILDSGGLVPDELTIALMKDRLAGTSGGFILDGFPRTVPQADALADFATIDGVVLFTLNQEAIVQRLSGRRLHKASGRTYHVLFNPPQVEGKDDVTGEPLVVRPDDQEEAIRTRLAVYDQQTAPLIEYYRQRNLLVEVDASPKPDEVFRVLVDVLR